MKFSMIAIKTVTFSNKLTLNSIVKIAKNLLLIDMCAEHVPVAKLRDAKAINVMHVWLFFL